MAEALANVLEGSSPRVGDVLIQRFKALEPSVVGGSWVLARRPELTPSADAGLAPVAERSPAARLEMQRQKLIEGATKTKEAAKVKEKGGGAMSGGSRQYVGVRQRRGQLQTRCEPSEDAASTGGYGEAAHGDDHHRPGASGDEGCGTSDLDREQRGDERQEEEQEEPLAAPWRTTWCSTGSRTRRRPI